MCIRKLGQIVVVSLKAVTGNVFGNIQTGTFVWDEFIVPPAWITYKFPYRTWEFLVEATERDWVIFQACFPELSNHVLEVRIPWNRC